MSSGRSFPYLNVKMERLGCFHGNQTGTIFHIIGLTGACQTSVEQDIGHFGTTLS